MQLFGIGLVRVGAGDDARAARAARADGEEGVGELHSALGQAIEMRRPDFGIAGAAKVVPRQIIGDHEHDVRSRVCLAKRSRGRTGEGRQEN